MIRIIKILVLLCMGWTVGYCGLPDLPKIFSILDKDEFQHYKDFFLDKNFAKKHVSNFLNSVDEMFEIRDIVKEKTGLSVGEILRLILKEKCPGNYIIFSKSEFFDWQSLFADAQFYLLTEDPFDKYRVGVEKFKSIVKERAKLSVEELFTSIITRYYEISNKSTDTKNTNSGGHYDSVANNILMLARIEYLYRRYQNIVGCLERVSVDSENSDSENSDSEEMIVSDQSDYEARVASGHKKPDSEEMIASDHENSGIEEKDIMLDYLLLVITARDIIEWLEENSDAT